MRLVLAALSAVCIHLSLFLVEMPWSRAALTISQSRAVAIDLVAVQKPVEKPLPPKPKAVKPRPKPKIKPEPAPKPVPRPVPPPEPLHRPVPPEPVPEPTFDQEVLEPDLDAAIPVDEPEPSASEEHPADEADDRAVVQASKPLYDLNPPPKYPRAAYRRNYQGTVMLDVRVTVDGSAAEVRIAQSSGYAILDRCALNAVKRWRFSPARRGDRPFEMWVQVPVRFELQ
ncbi:MAG: energy transducer TonB [Desulfobacteraceae bacterium]|jgi:protein TonB